MSRSPEADAALEELLQQMAIMTGEELCDYFFGYLARMKTAYPDPADQERPRRALEEFLRERAAALEAAMEKLARAEDADASAVTGGDHPWPS